MQRRCSNNILKQLARIRSLPQNQKCRDYILILDEYTSKKLSDVLSMEELLSFGIKDLCRVDKLKQPNPTAFAIYYIRPLSLPYVYKDFESKDIYFSVNILLCSEADEPTMHSLTQETKVIERLASFGELYLPCCYLSQQISVFQDAPGIDMLPSIIAKDTKKTAETYSKQLFRSLVASYTFVSSTCIKIHWYTSPFSEQVALLLQQLLIDHLQELKEQSNEGEEQPICLTGSREAAEIIVVVADRQLDMLSPLVRSFYYSPLLMDLFCIHEQQTLIQIISDKIAPTTLSRNDPIFVKYGHMHLYRVFEVINDNLQAYIKHNKAAQFQKAAESKEGAGDSNQAKELREVMRDLPAYNKMVSSYNANIDILGAMKKIITERGMNQLTELEHLVITGVNGRREPEKDKKILQKVMQVIYPKSETGRGSLSKEDKCRLLLLAICSLDMGNEDRAKLIKLVSGDSQYGSLATKISTITVKGIRKLVLPAQNINSAKQVYVDRLHTVLGNTINDILQSKTPKNFKLAQIGSMGKQSKLKMFKAAPHVFVSMFGSLGYNEICNVCQVVENNPPFNKQGKEAGSESVCFISDKLVNPSAYLNSLLSL